MWLRFMEGRPISALTIQFLEWSCAKAEAQGKRALLLVWDNAGWHISHEVRDWIRAHNWAARQRRQFGCELEPHLTVAEKAALSCASGRRDSG